MLSNPSVLATESTSNLQEEKTMEVDEQQQSGKDQSEANNNEPIEMIESSSSSPKNTQKEDGITKNTPKSVDCIELLEDDENESSSISHSIQAEEKDKDTPNSKTKNLNNSASSTPLNSYNVLLDRLELYVLNALDKGENMDRKVLDALLAAINIQVQKEPYAVRKLILDKQLVLPNTISFPPSQVVDLLIEHDPDHQLSRVINRLFGEERPKLAENERRERQYLRATNPAPNMTKLLMDMGQDLVQESTYFDIVHAKNLPEMPKNMDTYKQMCRRDLTKLRNIQMGRAVEDINVINRWLWDKPPIEPSILTFRGSATPNQVLPPQQLLRQQRALLMSGGNSVSPSLASRLGIQQQTRNSQQLLSSLSPAQLAALATSSLKAAGGTDLFLIYSAAGGSDSSTIPTIGDVLRFAKDSNEPGSQKSNQILAAAAAAAGIKTGSSSAALAQGRTLN
uniref:Uncharacterized protein n=1 Tax=Meloidogyne javanica TaxID=6303 RepID=A0A915LJ17_MELJA